ncbi:MAG TPA: hypothetical protein VLC09_07405 [Polyangiaceae bacterium]|nr:hypothetical protein [Polyangiaceae bacterium]
MRLSLQRFAVLLGVIAASGACNLILGNETGKLEPDSGSGGSPSDSDGEGGAGGLGSGTGGQGTGGGITIPETCEYEEAGGFCYGDCLATEGPGPRVKNATWGAFTTSKAWMDGWTNWSTNSSRLTADQKVLRTEALLPQNAATHVLGDDILADKTLTADQAWVISGTVHVRDGVTLTIEPGTLILGSAGSTLVISRGGRIDAQGTVDAPIIMTSSAVDGDRERGQWGGVVLLGRANNFEGPDVQVAGLESDVLNQHGEGGGTVEDGGDCGTLKYVRIEFSGAELVDKMRLNGLTVGSCGSATSISYVQLNTTWDDAFEFFGGMFDVDHLVANNPGDDMIDLDLGWRGTIDTFFGRQILPTTVDSSGLEWDSSLDFADQPTTDARARNATLCGASQPGNPTFGAVLRERVGGSLDNLAIMGFDAAFDTRDDFLTLGTGQLPLVTVENSAVWANHGGVAYDEDPAKVLGQAGCNAEPKKYLCDDDLNFNEVDWFLTPANANEVLEP